MDTYEKKICKHNVLQMKLQCINSIYLENNLAFKIPHDLSSLQSSEILKAQRYFYLNIKVSSLHSHIVQRIDIKVLNSLQHLVM